MTAVPLPDREARREALLDAADRIVQRDGPAVEQAHGRVQNFLRRFSELLALGIATELGLKPGSPRAETWARGIVGMVQSAGDWWLIGGAPDRDAVVRELTDLLWGAYPAAAAARGARDRQD